MAITRFRGMFHWLGRPPPANATLNWFNTRRLRLLSKETPLKVSRARWARPVAFAAVALFAVGCAASQADGKSGDDSIVARIGDDVITTAELEKEVSKRDAKAFQAYYDAKKKVLDEIIIQRLIDAEILKRGISESELKTEMTSGVAAVTEAEVQAFYTKNKGRMGPRTLEQAGPQIVQRLTNQKNATALSDFIADLKKKASVQIMIEPPRMEVKIAANDPRKGAEGAPITLIEFSDFQ